MKTPKMKQRQNKSDVLLKLKEFFDSVGTKFNGLTWQRIDEAMEEYASQQTEELEAELVALSDHNSTLREERDELKPKWIKASDILPEPFEKVLVYAYPPSPTMSGKKIMAIDYIREFKHLKGSMRDRLENNKGFSYNVTHWMPLPSCPI